MKVKGKMSMKKESKKTKSKDKKLNKGIIYDPVSPYDFLHLNFAYCCEQCSYFDWGEQKCSLGHFHKPHLRRNQIKSYTQWGRMAFCRNHEMD